MLETNCKMDDDVNPVLTKVSKEHKISSNAECIEYFDEWSAQYDQDLQVLSASLPLRTAKLFVKCTKNMDVREVLDVGAGTCLCEEFLRNDVQYKGEIDALDGSMEMLYQASKKPINLRNIIRHCVIEQLPVRDRSYDVVICVGSFLPKHILPTALPGILNAVRPGGLLIFNLREKTREEYDKEFDLIISKLVDEEKMKLVTIERFALFDKTEEKHFSNLFAYKRL